MKFKPVYMYGIIFVVIIVAIVFTSSNNKKEVTTISTQQGDKEMPQDALHQGIGGVSDDAPSRGNVREDFWIKMDKYKADIEANPNDTLAMRNYAQMLGMSHKTNEAIELYDRILAIDPNRIDILLAKGLTFYNAQNFIMAEVVTKEIIALDDKNLEAKYNLGAILASQGKNDEARKVWKELSDKYPNDEVGKLATNALVQISK
ncbi:MAG: hypothetical protein L3J41_06600 [Melioribacteraceae bacterium]|nr:hypothetical protein [Melioribacteraceae bacterium]